MTEINKMNAVSVMLALVAACASFWIASTWGSAVFSGLFYYYLPATAVMLGLAAALVWTQLKIEPLSELMVAVLLASTLGCFFGLADGLLASHVNLSRWVSWGQFQGYDAADFLDTASSYLVNATFETPRGRVISNLLYAGLLDLTNIDVVTTTRLITASTLVGASMAALVALRLWGPVAAGVFALVLFDYAQEHVGGTSTEIPGFLLGVLAFGVLLQASSWRSGPTFLLGFALLTGAMLTRVGAAFILPALALWSGYALRPLASRRWLLPLCAIGVLATMFMANGALTRAVAPTAGGSFSNAADSWYASLVEGHLLLGERDEADVIPVTRWRQLYLDHPEIETLPTAQQPAKKLAILVDSLVEYPLAGIAGGAREVVVYFVRFRMFQFVEIKPVRVVLTLLTCLGFFVCVRKIKRGEATAVDQLLGVGAIAIVASLPFLYGGETRAPAPTVAFLAALSAIGARYLWRIVVQARRGPIDSDTQSYPAHLAPNIVVVNVVVAVLFSATFVHGLQSGGSWGKLASTCAEPGQVGPVYMNARAAQPIGPGTRWTSDMLDDTQQAITELRVAPILASIAFEVDDRRFGGLAKFVANLKEPKWLGYGLDLSTGELHPYTMADMGSKTILSGCANSVTLGLEMVTDSLPETSTPRIERRGGT